MLSTGTALTALDALAAPLVCAFALGITSPVLLTASSVTAALVGRGADLQRSRLVLDVAGDVTRLLALSAAIVLLTVALASGLDAVAPVSIATTLTATIALFVLLATLRAGLFLVVTLLRRRGTVAHPVVIVGADPTAARLAQCLRDRPGHGLTPIGVVVTGAADEDTDLSSVPILGDLSQLGRILAEHQVDDVIFSGSDSDRTTLEALRACLAARHQVFIVPRFHELVSTEQHRRTELVRDIALTRLRRRSRGLRATLAALAPTHSASARVSDARSAAHGGLPQRVPLHSMLTRAAVRRAERRREIAGTSGWTTVAQAPVAASGAGQPRYRNDFSDTLALFDELRDLAPHPHEISTTSAGPAAAAPTAGTTLTSPAVVGIAS